MNWDGRVTLGENWWFGLVMMCVAVCIGGCLCMMGEVLNACMTEVLENSPRYQLLNGF